MPSPSTALATLRPDLGGSFEEFDLAMDRQGFIATRVLPVLEVAKASGVFGKIPIEQLLKVRETKRAPGGGYSRGKFTFTSASFACEEHGAEEPVDDNESKLYAEYFDAEIVAAARARDAVLRNQEVRAAALLFNTTTWTGAALTTGVETEWDTIDTAVPVTNVEAAVRKVYDGSGLWCNALIITKVVFRNLRRCAQIVDMAKSQGFMDVRPGKITAAQLAVVFDLPHIIVAGGTKDSALEGQSSTPALVWGVEYAMVARIAETNDIREPCVGRTFHWGEDGSQIGGLMEEYRDERVRGDIVRSRHQVDEVVLYAQAAHLLSNVTT